MLKLLPKTFTTAESREPRQETNTTMPGETKTAAAAAAESETPTKGKKQQPVSSSKAALARVTLLDGSLLDVTIDVSLGRIL